MTTPTQEHAALVALVAEWQEITREFRDAGDDWKSAQAKRWRRAVDALLAFPLPSGCVTTSAMVTNQPSDHNYGQAALAAAPAGEPVGEPADLRSRMQDAFFAGVTRANDPRPIHENFEAWERGE
jgi:hypothetical protein